ncbi:MAG: hypothetical protein E6103_13115 [Enterococcus faecalis]|nr:hypothetical protein [Enterococcus faecalis]
MRDFSLLDSEIDEMERVLLGNKPREAEEIYLQNAIDFIERFIKQLIEESKLNENQQIVLNWLKEEMKKENMFPISCLWELQSWHAPKNVCSAYLSLDKDRQFQLLSAFIEWFEQEEK